MGLEIEIIPGLKGSIDKATASLGKPWTANRGGKTISVQLGRHELGGIKIVDKLLRVKRIDRKGNANEEKGVEIYSGTVLPGARVEIATSEFNLVVRDNTKIPEKKDVPGASNSA